VSGDEAEDRDDDDDDDHDDDGDDDRDDDDDIYFRLDSSLQHLINLDPDDQSHEPNCPKSYLLTG
jgi:hypothetical protein